MFKISAIVAGALALSVSAALAQTNSGSATSNSSKAQTSPQQAMAPDSANRAVDKFIFDEYGNVYNGRGEIIKPRLLKQPFTSPPTFALPSDR